MSNINIGTSENDLLEKIFPSKDYRTYGNFDEKDFKKYCPTFKYQPIILPKRNRIIAIGDLHGDYRLTIKSLKIAKVINDNLNWIGDDTVVVQVGDQIDRCRPFNTKCDHPEETDNDEASDILILKLFNDLHNKAIKHGGAVISLLGNHELMNVLGNLNYVSYLGLKEFENYIDVNNPSKTFSSGKKARKYAFKPGNEYAKLLACSRLPAVIIGSNLFVHAGIIPEFMGKVNMKRREDLYKLNVGIRKWLLGLIDKNYVRHIVESFKYSMFWDRILGSIPHNVNNNDSRCIKYLKPVLKILNVGKMIIGHTPQIFNVKAGINSACDNNLWRIDYGGSDAFSKFSKYQMDGSMDLRKVQVLEILNDKNIRILSAI